eukprot:1161780-Pelagomonas_calceolata.AAC.5
MRLWLHGPFGSSPGGQWVSACMPSAIAMQNAVSKHRVENTLRSSCKMLATSMMQNAQQCMQQCTHHDGSLQAARGWLCHFSASLKSRKIDVKF